MQVVCSAIMNASRALQHELLGGGERLRHKIRRALNSRGRTANPVVACQGIAGAYAEQAARILYPGASVTFRDKFEDVFLAVANQEANIGIMPVENSCAGSVHEAYDLILKYRFRLVAALNLPIHHCLAGKKGARVKDVRQVGSHPQALMQCRDFIRKHALTAVSRSNTAVAAAYAAKSGDPAAAAICSREAAALYGLKVLRQDIQRVRNNSTRFIAIAKQLRIDPDADKISVAFSLPHVAGSLYNTLARFAVRGLHLTKIESQLKRF